MHHKPAFRHGCNVSSKHSDRWTLKCTIREHDSHFHKDSAQLECLASNINIFSLVLR